MKYDLNQLKSIPITEVANVLGITIKSKKAFCFYGHDKKTPSLSFNANKNYYHCFGCGESGDTIKLVQEYLNIGFIKACEWLTLNFCIPSYNHRHSLHVEAATEDKAQCNTPNTRLYKQILDTAILQPAGRTYLNKRGIKDSIINEQRVFSISNSKVFKQYLLTSWDIEALSNCGLITNKNNLIWPDNSIIFPFFDVDGDIKYFQSRNTTDSKYRYMNLQNVQPIIYNVNIVQRLHKGDKLIICEGVMDTLSLLQNNINAIGVLGSNGFKKKWLEYFKDFEMYIIPDNDTGGNVFNNNVTKMFASVGQNITTINLKHTNDINDLIK